MSTNKGPIDQRLIERVYKEVCEFEVKVSKPPEKNSKVQNRNALEKMNEHIKEAKQRISDLRSGRTFICKAIFSSKFVSVFLLKSYFFNFKLKGGTYNDFDDDSTSPWDAFAQTVRSNENAFKDRDFARELLLILQLLGKTHANWQMAYNCKNFHYVNPSLDQNLSKK